MKARTNSALLKVNKLSDNSNYSASLTVYLLRAQNVFLLRVTTMYFSFCVD